MVDFDQYFLHLKSRSKLGYIYRNYWLYPRLAKYLSGQTLDVGCGIGDMLSFRMNTIGVDINPRTVDYCISLGLNAHLMSPGKLPFQSGEFDSVLLDNVLEHLEDPMLLLQEIHRVLKKDVGVVLIGVPGIKGWASDPDHKTFYDEKTLIVCLEQYGFQHEISFSMPLFQSKLFSRTIRQYCLYSRFIVV